MIKLIDRLVFRLYSSMSEKINKNNQNNSEKKVVNKIVKCIKSCKTKEQLDNCLNLMNSFNTLYNNEFENKWLSHRWQRQFNKLNNKEYIAFIEDVMKHMVNRPDYIRKGQAVFNYIDEKYKVARIVQFNDKIDCFYNDDMIYNFIEAAYKHIKNEN